MYCETPLVALDNLAVHLGVKKLLVKDESYRFGLNAFKALGGSYAIAKYLSAKLGSADKVLDYATLCSEASRKALGDITFITATDGNHGRGVAFTANKFGMKSVVLMPKGSAEERLENIKKEGADASITELNYDDTVRLASRYASERGYVLVQDTAWEGYTDIPTWIIEGYCSMAYEAYMQMSDVPTHIFIQAGVGSLAAAVIGFFAEIYPEATKPTMVVVEPNAADCFARTFEANDGTAHFVGGDMQTIMAGLACGEPCSIALDILRSTADFCISCEDYVAANGMRILSSPLATDTRVVSGESGAATTGCLAEIMTVPSLTTIRDSLGLDENSVVLLFSTEGATDKQNYRDTVWYGKDCK